MASVSGMLRTTTTILSMSKPKAKVSAPPSMAVECSSRPKKKATAHHMKTRPKKTQPWDVKRRGPTLYPPLPALPPDWTLVSSDPSLQDPLTLLAQQQQQQEEEDDKVEEELASP